MEGDADATRTRRKISPDPETAELAFLEIVAALEDRPIDELPSLYRQVDHFLETLFQDPPSPKAGAELAFSYAGYRVQIDQTGWVTLLCVKDSLHGSDPATSTG